MTEMFKKAKEKDRNGKFAKLGMKTYLSEIFNIDINAKCIKYFVDTYLEHVDNIDFDKWVYGVSYSTPIILTQNTLKKHYSDILCCYDDLESIANLFMYLYEQEFYVDIDQQCLYATEVSPSFVQRKTLQWHRIIQEYERLCVLHEREILGWGDIDEIVQYISNCGYDIESNYEYRTDDVYKTSINIQERLKQIFPLE